MQYPSHSKSNDSSSFTLFYHHQFPHPRHRRLINHHRLTSSSSFFI